MSPVVSMVVSTLYGDALVTLDKRSARLEEPAQGLSVELLEPSLHPAQCVTLGEFRFLSRHFLLSSPCYNKLDAKQADAIASSKAAYVEAFLLRCWQGSMVY